MVVVVVVVVDRLEDTDNKMGEVVAVDEVVAEYLVLKKINTLKNLHVVVVRKVKDKLTKE